MAIVEIDEMLASAEKQAKEDEVKAFLNRPSLREAKQVKSTIDTIQGIAFYLKTEIEDAQGKWNDRYETRDGYWVIHEGKYHHVYQTTWGNRKWDPSQAKNLPEYTEMVESS